MKNNFEAENISAKSTRRKKRLTSQKKPKYNLSKIREYENYLDNLRLSSRGGEQLDFN